MDLVIRERQDDDLPALAKLLERQQPQTRYPFVWPFPVPIAEFLKRPTELRAWVAEIEDEVVGHIAVESVGDDPIGRSWATAHDTKLTELRCVSVFFSDISRAGQGIGSRLLATATEFALADGYPVLDVVAAHETPVNLYLRRGWQLIETTQAPWHPEIDIPIHLMILPRPR
ncbi:GNAT family N-acetyltransferase [Flexivirga alba]|uniref:GNAT family N-acetyltransferase n=1 Tax=Flexivirga alba TaxID=702742 RepID=A0ABW2AIM7_9MICO